MGIRGKVWQTRGKVWQTRSKVWQTRGKMGHTSYKGLNGGHTRAIVGIQKLYWGIPDVGVAVEVSIHYGPSNFAI